MAAQLAPGVRVSAAPVVQDLLLTEVNGLPAAALVARLRIGARRTALRCDHIRERLQRGRVVGIVERLNVPGRHLPANLSAQAKFSLMSQGQRYQMPPRQDLLGRHKLIDTELLALGLPHGLVL